MTNLNIVASPYIFFIVANGCGFGFEVVSRGNRQCEHIDAVATISGGQAVPNGVGASGTLTNLHIVAFPNIFIIVANSSSFRSIVGRIDSQCQRIDTVAAINGMISGGMCAFLADLSSLPHYRQLVIADGIIFREAIYRINGNNQNVHIVATILIVNSISIGT